VFTIPSLELQIFFDLYFSSGHKESPLLWEGALDATTCR
jgi:hypothetical protein